MGDPKFSRRRYVRPSHPWIGDRIEEERKILKKYGLKSKRELWKMESFLRRSRAQARSLQAKLRLQDEQAKKETSLLLNRLKLLGILKGDANSIDDVLAVTLDTVLGRRLESIVFYKGLARTQGQARQFITHGHIVVNDRRVTIPSYLVRKDEEDKIRYHPRSPLSDPMHPLLRPPEEETTSDESAKSEEKKGDAEKEKKGDSASEKQPGEGSVSGEGDHA